MAAPGDHFSGVAEGYARFRPRYPAALFSYLASVSPGRMLAWDAGTGNGQAALSLADHFARVRATDVSAAQLAQAPPHPRVDYAVALAERSGLPEASADLVTVAQALHWFDRPAFFAEAARVLRPDGVLAVWSYGPLRVASEAVQGVMARFYHEVVGPYWPPERRLVDAGYRDVVLPFEEMAAPGFSMEAALTLEQLAGYAGTWSATQAFEKARGEDPTEALRRALAGVWGDHETTRVVRWPLALRVARKERAG